jgi:alpha-1,6-rhamnosyltransferase
MTAEPGRPGKPTVSVVIPTHNRCALLAGCLASLLALNHPGDDYEIVVVAAGCSDDTVPVVESCHNAKPGLDLRCLRTDRRDANSARNLGFRAARGELFVLVDDDVVVPPGWLTALTDGARAWPDAECLGGPVRPLLESPSPRTCRRHEPAGVRLDDGAVSRDVAELWGGNLVIRRGALLRLGEFEPGLRVGQEWEWEQRLLRAGGRLRYLPEAWLWHRRGRSDLSLAHTLPEHFRRGYLKAQVGPAVTPAFALHDLAGNLLHAIRCGCSRGLTEAARQLGVLCGILTGRTRVLGGFLPPGRSAWRREPSSAPAAMTPTGETGSPTGSGPTSPARR